MSAKSWYAALACLVLLAARGSGASHNGRVVAKILSGFWQIVR